MQKRNREIQRLYQEEHLSQEEIGVLFNRSRARIGQILTELGAARPRRTATKTVHPQGYVLIYYPSHPHARQSGYVLEHRLVAEKMLGRYLEPNEIVWHLNGDSNDNRPKNLEVRPRKRFTDEQLLQILRWVAVKLGHTPTHGLTPRVAGFDTAYHLWKFGGLRRALKAIGLEITGKGKVPNLLPMRFQMKWGELEAFDSYEEALESMK